MQRRNFTSNTAYTNIERSLLGLYACKNNTSKHGLKNNQNAINTEFNSLLELSLARWSLHKMNWKYILCRRINIIRQRSECKIF